MSNGPPAASGWNWTEKKGFETCVMPSFVRSLALMKRDFQPSGSAVSSTAKPWFWDVM